MLSRVQEGALRRVWRETGGDEAASASERKEGLISLFLCGELGLLVPDPASPPAALDASAAHLASSSEELAEKVTILERKVNDWIEKMRSVTRRINEQAREHEAMEKEGDAKKKQSEVPNVLKSGFLTVSAKTGAGIQELAATIQATLTAEDERTGARLFPRFQAPVPVVYEHVRGFLRAVIYGEDEAAALSKRPEQSLSLIHI